jgi:hypothetical protein
VKSSRAGRAVFGVNAAVSVALVVLVAAIALVVNPPSPPGIAAFAPQAAKPITKAPLGQSSVTGQGAGGLCAAGKVCSRPSATPRPSAKTTIAPPPTGPAKGVPSALQCYTWPDGTVTQTFDPQSPPCIASWPGQDQGNGGATTQGVTGSTIQVAFPQAAPKTSQLPKLQPLVDFFNTRFQMYGRHLKLVPFASAEAASQQAGKTNANPSNQKADAAGAAALHPFAALDFADMTPYIPATATYLDGLASHQVIAAVGGTIAPTVSAASLEKRHPLQWSYQPTSDQILQSTAQLTCRQLVGRRAGHAVEYAADTRTFAVVLPDVSLTGSPLPGRDAFLKTLAGCGITGLDVITYSNENGDAASLSAAFLKLKNKGITSLLFYPALGGGAQGAPQKAASNAAYHPEWITMGAYSWTVAGLEAGAADEVRNTFGVAAWNKLPQLSAMPWVQAYTAAGGSGAAVGGMRDGEAVYHELLLIASGVQLAGPHLTPQTFGGGLRSTTFPNPGAGAAPSYQARVGFASGNTMMNDLAGFWMDPSANTATTTSAGSTNGLDPYNVFCYVALGARWTETGWPAADGFYKGTCR